MQTKQKYTILVPEASGWREWQLTHSIDEQCSAEVKRPAWFSSDTIQKTIIINIHFRSIQDVLLYWLSTTQQRKIVFCE